ncbi:MAG: AbrB/MazE/SpoVT family DNA-binding domain-containing protein [Patescibacteria group bacterium]|nr:AbrB/MazE/SpoVT family DNA-binding domain-containing protein [Patescibacteria group bacterium]
MASQRKVEDRDIRKLTKTGGGRSMSITLPIEYIRYLGWRDGQKVVVNMKGKKIIIEDWE